MRVVRRRVPGRIKYPRKCNRTDSESLEDALRRVLRGRSRSLTIAAAPGPRRRDIVRRYYQWRVSRRSVSDENLLVIGRARQANLTGRRRVNDLNASHSERLRNPSGEANSTRHLVFGSARTAGTEAELHASNYRAASHLQPLSMMSQNDSIIWNNRSSERLDSNLSLVVNPPSSLSQHEDSVVSEDSQYTRSSQLDLALEDERRWMKYRIESLTRDECIITCVLAQMMLCSDELPGNRDLIPSDEEAKQSLLYMSYGGCWELNNLRTILDLAEFLPVGLRRLCGLGVRDRGSSSRKVLEGRLEQCLDLRRRLNLQQAG